MIVKLACYSFLLFTLSLAGACVALQGYLEKGVYHAPGKVFSVRAPSIPKFSLKDGFDSKRVYVDFFSGPGYWRPYGQYSIELLKLDGMLKSVKDFKSASKSFIPEYLQRNYDGAFQLANVRETRVGEQDALQFYAFGNIDNHAAVWVGTIMNYKTRIAIANLVYPIEVKTGQSPFDNDPARLIPHKEYQQFVKSFHVN